MSNDVSLAVAEGMARTIERNLFEVRDVDDLPQDAVHASLHRDNFACLRGLISPHDVETSRRALARHFSRENDHPSVGEAPRAVRSNFQKLSVGGVQNITRASMQRHKLVRTFYNPLWDEDIYSMHHIFRRMAEVRNVLAGKHRGFAVSDVEDGLWTASRIHQYPTGGGFMGVHQDAIGVDVVADEQIRYYQIILVMSRKGVDFDTGGAFVEHADGILSFEDHTELGDIVIYDGRTLHGVEDIDPHKPLNLDMICGRLAAFVSLYRNLP